jgi:hypothetical protein
LEPEPTQHNSLNRLQIRKYISAWLGICCSVDWGVVAMDKTYLISNLLEICRLFGTKETKIITTEISNQNFGMKQERN